MLAFAGKGPHPSLQEEKTEKRRRSAQRHMMQEHNGNNKIELKQE